ncbi:hypothetical protein D3C85_1589730 [compost metagenome]
MQVIELRKQRERYQEPQHGTSQRQPARQRCALVATGRQHQQAGYDGGPDHQTQRISKHIENLICYIDSGTDP